MTWPRQKGFPVVSMIDDSGFYTEGEWQGQQVWEVNKEIAKSSHERGVVWKIDYIRHSYPHCHRCGTQADVPGSPQLVHGYRRPAPADAGAKRRHLTGFRSISSTDVLPRPCSQRRTGTSAATASGRRPCRSGKAPTSNGKEHIKVVGTYEELQELSGVELEDYHRPWIDDVTFTIDDVEYQRIDKVLDCWFESGSMPFAQFHYPFENVEKFEQNFPGDFIVEYVGQVRAWFYYLHAVSCRLVRQELPLRMSSSPVRWPAMTAAR